MGNQQSSPPPGKSLISSVLFCVLWWQAHWKGVGINEVAFGLIHQVLMSLVIVGLPCSSWLSLRELKRLILNQPWWGLGLYQGNHRQRQVLIELDPSSLLSTFLVTTKLLVNSLKRRLSRRKSGRKYSQPLAVVIFRWRDMGGFHSFIPSFFYSPDIYWWSMLCQAPF